MKKKYVIFSLLLVGSVIAIVGFIRYFHLFFQDFTQKELIFSSVDSLFIDDQNNIYLVDQGMRRLLKINKEQNIDFIIIGGEKEKDFYRIADIAVDKKQNIYLLVFKYNEVDGYMEKYEIQKYNKRGNWEETIFSFAIEKKEDRAAFFESFVYAITGLVIQNTDLYFFSCELTGELVLWQYDLFTKNKKKIETYPIDTNKILQKPVLGKDGQVYALKKDGKLYRYDKNKNLKPVISNQAGKKFWSFAVEKDGTIYATELISRKIVKIDQKNNKIVDFQEQLEEKQIFYNLNINQELLITSHEITKEILIFDKKGKKIQSFEKAMYSHWEIFKRLFFWFLFLLGVGFIFFTLFYFYKNILDSYVPLLVQHLVIFIPLLLGGLYFTANEIYQALFQKYEEEIKKELSAMAQLGSKLIDSESFQKIKDPGDFKNPYYEKTRENILDILNNYADPWNTLLFNVVYQYKNGLFYVICDDSGYYGTHFPYTHLPQEYYETYEKGTILTANYSDNNGNYFVGIAPIKDKKGNIIGVYEVGFYLDFAREIQAIFKQKVLESTILSSIFYILLFSISTYFLLLSIRVLRNAIQKISNGHTGVQISIKRRDEIGDLGNGFNQMSLQLKKYIDEITELNKNLEKKVEERTQELNKAYQQLQIRNKTIENDIIMAGRIQKSLLPKIMPTLPNVSFQGIYAPMEGMGGDFYDFIPIDEKKIGIFISDVSGHGVAAAFITSMIKTLINTVKKEKNNPKSFLEYLNKNLLNQTNGNFLTACYAIYDSETKTMTYAKAAHPEGLIIHKNGELSFLQASGKFLAIFPKIDFEEKTISLQGGDKVLFYTDGLIEAVNSEKEEFEKYFIELVKTNYHLCLDELIEKIMQNLYQFQETQEDDICIVGLSIEK